MDITSFMNKKRLSKDEKKLILKEAEALGIDTNINTECSNCYKDILVQIHALQKIEIVEQDEDVASDLNFELKDGVDVYLGAYKRIRINKDTITPELADKLHAATGMRYFKTWK